MDYQQSRLSLVIVNEVQEIFVGPAAARARPMLPTRRFGAAAFIGTLLVGWMWRRGPWPRGHRRVRTRRRRGGEVRPGGPRWVEEREEIVGIDVAKLRRSIRSDIIPVV